MRIAGLCILALAIASPTSAQDVSGEESSELNELDLLSRSADDPFAGVIDQEKRAPISVTLRALDKITARYTDIEIPMNEIKRFGSLELLPRTCDKRPPEEFPETTVFLEIFDTEYGNRQSDLKNPESIILDDDIEAVDVDSLDVNPVGDLPPTEAPAEIVADGPQAEGVNIFLGWMFASSPALNALEHPVYDVWVIDCKTRVVDN